MTLLTVDELREHVNSALGDTALERLLADAEAAIVQRAGPPGDRTQIAGGGYRFIALHRPATAITSIVERQGTTDTTLAADDYLLRPGGYLLERLTDGTHPRGSCWAPRVTVIHSPVDDEATRIAVQIDLVNLELSFAPGLAEQTIGEWTERYTNNSAWNSDTERETILARLDVDAGMMVVGNPG